MSCFVQLVFGVIVLVGLAKLAEAASLPLPLLIGGFVLMCLFRNSSRV